MGPEIRLKTIKFRIFNNLGKHALTMMKYKT